MERTLKGLCLLLLGMLLVACSGNDMRAAWRTYPDEVVNINQVDPAYRAYFRSQQGANYSLRDQREAFMAAARTARTPVPKYVPQQASSARKKSTARRGKASPRKSTARTKSKKSKAKSKKPARKSTKRRR